MWSNSQWGVHSASDRVSRRSKQRKATRTTGMRVDGRAGNKAWLSRDVELITIMLV